MAVYKSYKDGPVGYGDPDNTTIADTERGTLFSKFVQERLMFELCEQTWSNWRRCIQAHKDSWIPSRKCKMEFDLVNDCQNTFLENADEIKKFESEYLEKRAEFRRTGVGMRFLTKDRLRESAS